MENTQASEQHEIELQSFKRIVEELKTNVNPNLKSLSYRKSEVTKMFSWVIEFERGETVAGISIFHDVLYILLEDYVKRNGSLL